MRVDSRLPGLSIVAGRDTTTVHTPSSQIRIPSGQVTGIAVRDVSRMALVVGRLGTRPPADTGTPWPGGELLAAVPCGGGWLEDSRRAQRYTFLPIGETAPRLRPIWSRTAVDCLARTLGLPVVEVKGGRSQARPVIVRSLNDAFAVDPTCVPRRLAATAVLAGACLIPATAWAAGLLTTGV